MFIFNAFGLFMLVVAFAIAFGVGNLIGTDAEGPLMIIAGPIVVAMDLTLRLKGEDGHLLIPNRGGSLFFLPAWVFGVLWLLLGIVYTVQDKLD